MATLTLNLDEPLLARAEELARARNMTVPEMLERYLEVLSRAPLQKDQMMPLTRQLAGSLPPMTDEEVRKTIDEARMEKYGR